MRITIKGILSFPHLFTARAVDANSDPKFSVNVLVPKNDPQVAQIQQALETEKANGFPSGFPPNGKVFLKDLAVEQPNKPELANYYEIRSSSPADSRPHVVDGNYNKIVDPGDVYPGCVAYVNINTFSYNKPMSKGIAAGLNGVMLTGEEGALGRLDSRPSVEEMFQGVAAGAPTAPPTQPAATAPAAPPPAPPAAPPAAPAAPQFVMTEKAAGFTREQYHAQGWTDEALLDAGMMIKPSFG